MTHFCFHFCFVLFYFTFFYPNSFTVIPTQYSLTLFICYRLKPAEFTSDIYLPALIPMPSCNCRSCKPFLYQMHANHNHLNHHRYQSQAITVVPSDGPPIPPQPVHYDYGSRFETSSIDIPMPPPRRYQVVPIQNPSQQSNVTNDPLPLVSFAKSMCDRDTPQRSINGSSSRTANRPIVIKDPRRKPYYYNELDQNGNNTEETPTNNHQDVINGNDKLISNCGSAGSLDNII